MTEEDLITLFNSLPRRCVVLLEDIDSAGVLRKKTEGEQGKKEDAKGRRNGKAEEGEGGKEEKKENEDPATTAASAIAKAVAEAVKGANDASEAGRRGPSLNNQGVSMSGLLNAIDGVASQEGRVLVMTTNHPEKLDDALVRPGRVDMRIEFALANKQQSRELFMRMYCADTQDLMRQPLKLSEILPVAYGGDVVNLVEQRTSHGHTTANGSIKTPYANGPVEKPHFPVPTQSMTPKKPASSSSAHAGSSIEELAIAFADALPEAVFSPAEIQGFLLTQKKDPLKAVLEVAAWRDVELNKKQPNKVEKHAAMESEAEAREVDDGKGGVPAALKADDPPLKTESPSATPESGTKALIGTAEGESGSESTSSASSGTGSSGTGASGGSMEDSGDE